jgi:hypothetical protein
MPQAEETAERSLRQFGYRAYLPRYRRLLLPHGRDRRTATAIRPLFTGLVFAQDWRGWPPITVIGTIGLLKVAGIIASISHADIELMQKKELACSFDDIPRPMMRGNIRPGDDCEVDISGSRIMAVLDELSDSGKAILRANILGREVKLHADADDLHAVSA